MSDEKRRFQLVMDQGMQRALEELKPWTGCGNETALIHDAVRFYHMIASRIREGERVYIGADPATAPRLVLPEIELFAALGRAP